MFEDIMVRLTNSAACGGNSEYCTYLTGMSKGVGDVDMAGMRGFGYELIVTGASCCYGGRAWATVWMCSERRGHEE